MKPETVVVTFDGGNKHSLVQLPGMWYNWRYDAQVKPDSPLLRSFAEGLVVPKELTLDILFSPFVTDPEENKVFVVLSKHIAKRIYEFQKEFPGGLLTLLKDPDQHGKVQ